MKLAVAIAVQHYISYVALDMNDNKRCKSSSSGVHLLCPNSMNVVSTRVTFRYFLLEDNKLEDVVADGKMMKL